MSSKVDAPASTPADPFGAFVVFCPQQSAGNGPLADLSLAVKDNIAVQGQPFTAGLPLFADRIADQDAEIVRRLKALGARVVGVTRTDAGGFGVTTPEVANPAMPGHVAGGSSGGSAAAAAAGLADIGLGTDTGGSVRIPAACCGIAGFKPTHGALPLDGVWPLASRLDTVGFMARNVITLERVAAVLLHASLDASAGSVPLRLGFDRERLAACDPVVTTVLEQALGRLTDHGVVLTPVALPDRDVTAMAHGALVLAEARSVYAQTWRASPHLFPDAARRALTAAAALATGDIDTARQIAATATAQFLFACQSVDAIVTPTLPVPPPRSDARRVPLRRGAVPVIAALLAETCLANVTGAPALSMPCPNRQDAFVSLQLMAPRGHDRRLIAIARRLETMLALP